MSDLDDLLARSTRALRETTSSAAAEGSSAPPPAHASADDPSDIGSGVAATTLARIERSARAKRVVKLRRRSYTRWIVMPMAASFVVFAAWASASGRLSEWVGLRTHEDDERATHSPHAPAAPSPPLSSRSAPSPSTPPPLEEPAPPAASDAAPSPPASSVKKAVAPPPAADSDALYRDAHDAHFVRRDPAAALAAWDRYLAAAGPSGRFTLEARYNRAISLVRLGRRAEAAKALRPFANGDYGGYRRDEAAQLLSTLE
jgi:hypothetical protein